MRGPNLQLAEDVLHAPEEKQEAVFERVEVTEVQHVFLHV